MPAVPERSIPEWSMPPPMVGGHVTGPVVVARSERAILIVRQVLAYSNGLGIEVEAYGRGTYRQEQGRGPDLDHGLRFSLLIADGRVARMDDESGLRDGRGPMMTNAGGQSGGGYDGSEDVRLSLWVWPLPPPGPVVLTCSWERAGLAEAKLTLDPDAIRTAAAASEPYWRTDRPDESL
ncbi:hypothetical protein ABUW04_11170 [Streptacidiphilus sp. N1-10]|uniref:Uncharacterized protein n=1 Tax=Streptacidiphilus jeojiensis TaxID=3229225 RepID=A0ABV6XKP5_9ACTN